MTLFLGAKSGLSRRATIVSYNGDSTVDIRIDEFGLQNAPQQFTIPMPLSWAGNGGQFIGGFPEIGSTVLVSQAQGGNWYIISFLPSATTQNNLDALQPGRILLQTSNNKLIMMDPNEGIFVGNPDVYVNIDPDRNIVSHDFDLDMSFSAGSRKITGPLKRDLISNSNRDVLGSALTSHIYDDSLSVVGLDPTASVQIKTTGDRVRNPALAESREIVYEFDPLYNVQSDDVEIDLLSNAVSLPIDNGRKDNRTDVFSLGLNYPNHLIEIVKGTGVDIFGNVLDINKNVLPFEKLSNASLNSNPDTASAYSEIKGLHRRAIAYSFELNAKKSVGLDENGAEQTGFPPDTTGTATVDYARDRSRFSLAIDKEGQVKLNIPMSSETGNIALPTRAENYSTLLAQQNADPTSLNDFVRNGDNQDIYLDSFAGKAAITLSATDSALDGYAAPLDRLTNAPMNFGTVFHDLTQVCLTSQIAYTDPIVQWNSDNTFNQLAKLPYIVNPNIVVEGTKSNAGGRSMTANLDGSLTLSIGANTSDRQSLLLDTAGGMVASFGRDLNNVSAAVSMDGDFLIEIGGTGIGNTFDSRFATANDAVRAGSFEIKVLKGDGFMTTFRIDQFGVKVATQGRLDFDAQQSINFKSHGDFYVSAENIVLFADSHVPRKIVRGRTTSI